MREGTNNAAVHIQVTSTGKSYFKVRLETQATTYI
jgi:hypothetical protein